MPKRSSKPKLDVNQLAASILEAAAGMRIPSRAHQIAIAATEAVKEGAKKLPKNPAAIALGRMGGLKGGKARAASLSPAKRAQIAKKAAAARWKK